jgi:hypothetical protein
MDATKLGHFVAFFKYYVAMYDNAAVFKKYLKKQGTDEAARKAGVKLKQKHSIVPHVCALSFM